MQQVKTQKKSIILTTHYMEEAELLCDDHRVMDRGKIIARGSLRRFCRRSLVTTSTSARADAARISKTFFLELTRSGPAAVIRRLLCVWHARNLEFVRDRSTLIFRSCCPSQS